MVTPQSPHRLGVSTVMSVAVFVAMACTRSHSEETLEAAQPQLISLTVGTPAQLWLEELSRTDHTSTVRVKYVSTGSHTLDIFLGCDGICKLAEARNFKYVASLRDGRDVDGATVQVLGLSNLDIVDCEELKKHFGNEVDADDDLNLPIKFISVADWKTLRREGYWRSPDEDR